MLVLSRQLDQSIIIGNDVVITVIAFDGHGVKLGITAPKEIRVDREEVRRRLERDGVATTTPAVSPLALENEQLKAEVKRLTARINRMVPSADLKDVEWRPGR